MEQENKQIELRSEKVRNIIGKIPPFLLRNGMAMIGVAIAMLIGVSAFLTYQPQIDTTINIHSGNNDEVYYSAQIPQKTLGKMDEYTTIIPVNTLGLPIPSRFYIQSVSDRVNLSHNNAWYNAIILPTDTTLQNFTLTEEINIPAKITLKKHTVLEWIFQSFRLKTHK